MQKLIDKIKEYKTNNNLSSEDCAKALNITVEQLNEIESGKATLSKKEINAMLKIVDKSYVSTSKKVSRLVDLILRFGASIMGLVTLLLCISESVSVRTLIAFLAISVVCLAITNLPKNDK